MVPPENPSAEARSFVGVAAEALMVVQQEWAVLYEGRSLLEMAGAGLLPD